MGSITSSMAKSLSFLDLGSSLAGRSFVKVAREDLHTSGVAITITGSFCRSVSDESADDVTPSVGAHEPLLATVPETPSPDKLVNGNSHNNEAAAAENQTRNLVCLGVFFASYFAFRSGCLVVLPLTCELLLKDKLGGATYSPLYQLPLTVWFIMDIFLAAPNALLMQRKGRRIGFACGAVCALVASLAAFFALSYISDPWTCYIVLNVIVALMSVIGMAEFVRYAAAEACTDAATRPKMVSRVISSAAIAASCGPLSSPLARLLEAAKFTGKSGEIHGYAAFFLFLTCFAGIGLLATLTLKLPPTPRAPALVNPDTGSVHELPLINILCRPGVAWGIFTQAVIQFAMVTPMSAVPLAMQHYTEPSPDNILISGCIVAHLFGMFVPGFFTGNLIARFGKFKMITAGLFIQAASQVVCLSGTEVWNFYLGLVLLGVGWNWAFVSSTMMLVDSHTVEERGRVTSVNETLRFLANAVGVLLSSTFSWTTLNWACLGFLSLLVFVLPMMRISILRWQQRCDETE